MSIQEDTRPATYADIEALPKNIVGEILFGSLYAHPRPRPQHALSATSLASEVHNSFHRGNGGPGGWIILSEPEVHLGEHVVVPDIAGWRRERLPVLPDAAYFDLAPDWVCEVLSPSTAQIDRTLKLEVYAEYDVGHVWFVDPDLRTLETMSLNGGRWMLGSAFKDNDAVSAAPFEAHTFDLGILWDDVG